jgi:hypothetical protein
MKLFNFLKKREMEGGLEKIKFEELKLWIQEKKEKIKEDQKEPQKRIKENLSILLQELEDRIAILEKIDLTDKKVPGHAKLIVKENLYKFMNYLEKLIDSLRDLEEESLEALINKINLLFAEFQKRSIISFQKATLLIGDELSNISGDIAKFFKVFNKIIQENKGTTELMKQVGAIEQKLKEFEDSEKIKLENSQKIKELAEEIANSIEKIEELDNKIDSLKTGETYRNYLKTKQELENARDRLDQELHLLKELINFKILAKIYHSDEKQMNIVKELREDFKEAYETHDVERLIEPSIKETDKGLIKERIKNIDEINQEIDRIRIGSNVTEDLEKEKRYLRRRIDTANFERAEEEKKGRRLRENKENLKTEIITNLKKINVEIKQENREF